MRTVAVFVENGKGGLRLVKTGVSEMDAMDYVWDPELNTEGHPIHLYDEESGNEIEW